MVSLHTKIVWFPRFNIISPAVMSRLENIMFAVQPFLTSFHPHIARDRDSSPYCIHSPFFISLLFIAAFQLRHSLPFRSLEIWRFTYLYHQYFMYLLVVFPCYMLAFFYSSVQVHRIYFFYAFLVGIPVSMNQ
ncbi:hypothetical protein BJ138DRAFT_897933 [Hygrophoropsis aurantiaca]|uniref:Uncharacterized protein n=1 Tax=Hygrophoropsis aurantiaca TaxID=72124 RepID=A0ACB7ZUP0_9AGAM|nr:hypothetical protein BJ138DRAFT_897933 [Hygrophoropsis aurantiaca]